MRKETVIFIKKAFKIFIAIVMVALLAFISVTPYFMHSNGYKYTVTGYYKPDPEESLPVKDQFLDILKDSEESNSTSVINMQEVRMAQLVEYEIPDMEENEIFFVVKSKDGAIVRTTINKDLAEALLEYYK